MGDAVIAVLAQSDLVTLTFWSAVLAAGVRLAVSVGTAAIGEMINERAGVLSRDEGAAREGLRVPEVGLPENHRFVVGENGPEGKTDAEGRYRLVGLPPVAEMFVHASAGGFQELSSTVDLGLRFGTTERLDLTPDQQEQIRPIVRRNMEQLSRVRNQSMLETQTTVESMQREISGKLTPEQRIKFEQMNRERARLDVTWGQWQLEQSYWSQHAQVESTARRRLNMQTPDPAAIQVVLP